MRYSMRHATKLFAWLSIGLGILLVACSSPSASHGSTPSVAPTPPVAKPAADAPIPDPLAQAQQLPLEAQTQIGQQMIQLEVARTPQQREIGLMYRTRLADDRGMLFLGIPRFTRFWMWNTLIPLDIIFIQDGQVKYIADNVPPCTSQPCPTYGPMLPVDQVIELRGGRAKELGLQVGQRIEIQPLPPQPSRSPSRG